MTNFGAGVETIGVTVSSFISNVVLRPGCQQLIHEEIDGAGKAGNLSNPPKLREMKEHLSFLNACVSESMRLRPVVGMPLVRVVPEKCAELEGHFLPAGVSFIRFSRRLARADENRDERRNQSLGFEPNKTLCGEDAQEWRPERWLEYTPERLRYLGMKTF